METLNDMPVMQFADQDAWQVWLEAEGGQSVGLWLKIAKKASGEQSVNYAEALDIALCYGWIDGQKRSYDDKFFLQKFTPRRPKSTWSKINVDKIAVLVAAGRMRSAGLAAVEAAKADGRWDQAYASPSTMTVPEDFQAALDASPTAQAFFATLNKTDRYSFLWRVSTARKPETRQARIETYISMLEAGQRL